MTLGAGQSWYAARLANPASPTLSMSNQLHDRPDSPCIGICSTLFDEVCQGCGRTAMEVANWVFFDEVEKQRIWERITREGTAQRFQPAYLSRRK